VNGARSPRHGLFSPVSPLDRDVLRHAERTLRIDRRLDRGRDSRAAETRSMKAIRLDTAIVAGATEAVQGNADTNSLYVLIASLALALLAMVVLLRTRW
jgi:hypothetical protein